MNNNMRVENAQPALDIERLEAISRSIRCDILKMLQRAGSGHCGGSLSAADIVVALYFHHLKHRPDDPLWQDRDRFIMSKGHCAPLLYAVLANSGYFPIEWLDSLRKAGYPLQGHPDMRKTPGVEVSTGSLGQGLSIGCGMAWAAKKRVLPTRVYVLMGDGECNEGQVWEAAMFARHYHLNNLIAIIDRNGLQVDGETEKVMSLEPFADKWKAFGWNLIDMDGHSFAEIVSALSKAAETKDAPTAIIANTIKGKGVSFMEGRPEWHGMAPDREQLDAALGEIVPRSETGDCRLVGGERG